MTETAIHAKYIELVRAPLFPVGAVDDELSPSVLVRRAQATGARPCEGEAEACEGQGCWYVNVNQSFAGCPHVWPAKGQLTKANQTKTKMENLARELQKVNRKLLHSAPLILTVILSRTTRSYECVN